MDKHKKASYNNILRAVCIITSKLSNSQVQTAGLHVLHVT